MLLDGQQIIECPLCVHYARESRPKSAHVTGLVSPVEKVIRCITTLPQFNTDLLKEANQEVYSISAVICLVFLEGLSVKLMSYISWVCLMSPAYATSIVCIVFLETVPMTEMMKDKCIFCLHI